MAKDNFARSLALVLVHEGGYVNHPRDPGGATNKGVTQKTYDGWRLRHGLVLRSVRHIQPDEIDAIYRRDYWDAVNGDALPAGVDYAAFDFAVNSGPNRAARYLQMAAGVKADGKVGPETLRAVQRVGAREIIKRVAADRLSFMRRQPTWDAFGRGWSRRVAEMQADAWEMAQ